MAQTMASKLSRPMVLDAAPEIDSRQLQLRASQLETLCVKRGLKLELVQHMQLLQQFSSLMPPAASLVSDLRAFCCMMSLNPGSLQDIICQVDFQAFAENFEI